MSDELSIDRAFERAQALIVVGRFDEATELMRRAVATDPDDSDLWAMLAVAFLGTLSLDEALRASEQSIAVDPEEEWGYRVRALVLWQLGRTEDALNSIRTASEVDPSSVLAWCHLAWFAAEIGRRQEARHAAKRARELDPEESQVWFASAWSERPGEAKEALKRAIELEPEEAMWHNNLGWEHLRRGELTEGIAALRRALELDPMNPHAPYNLTRALRWTGAQDEAARVFGVASERDLRSAEQALQAGATDRHRQIALLLWQRGMRERALDAAKEAVVVEPENPASWQVLSMVHVGLGETEKSRQALERALELVPDSMDFLADMAHLAMLDGRIADARSFADRVARDYPGEASTFIALGDAALAEGRVADAIGHYEEGLAQNFVDCCSRALIGFAHARGGDLTEAERRYEEAKTLSPTCVYLTQLGHALEQAAGVKPS